MKPSCVVVGLSLCLLVSTVESKRRRKFEEIFDEDALAKENDSPPLEASDTEPRSKTEFVPEGFANITEYASPLACNSQNTLSPGSSFMIQSPNFPSQPPRNTRCDWRFTLPSQSQVDLVCDFFNAPCGFRNYLRLRIPGARTIWYCNRNPNQIFRNQRLARITNTGNDRPMIISFIIPRFFSRSGQGVQCRVVSLGSSGTNPTSTTASPASTTQPAVSSTAPSAQACGIKGQGRIVGGNTATPNEWPWAVFLSIRTNAGSFFCGGSVISNRAVLTAAHCVEGAVSSVTVFFGCHQRSRADCDLVLTAPAQNVRPHPSYRNVGSGRDVAVIRLPQTITFTNTIRPVCLPTTPNNNFADNSLWVAGWGRTSTGGGLAPALKEATLDHIPLSSCRSVFGNIASDILCNRRGSGDTCQGDSGSGVTNLRSGRYFVDGIVSFGRRSCESEPSGNAEVFENLGFIQQNM